MNIPMNHLTEQEIREKLWNEVPISKVESEALMMYWEETEHETYELLLHKAVLYHFLLTRTEKYVDKRYDRVETEKAKLHETEEWKKAWHNNPLKSVGMDNMLMEQVKEILQNEILFKPIPISPEEIEEIKKIPITTELNNLLNRIAYERNPFQ